MEKKKDKLTVFHFITKRNGWRRMKLPSKSKKWLSELCVCVCSNGILIHLWTTFMNWKKYYMQKKRKEMKTYRWFVCVCACVYSGQMVFLRSAILLWTFVLCGCPIFKLIYQKYVYARLRILVNVRKQNKSNNFPLFGIFFFIMIFVFLYFHVNLYHDMTDHNEVIKEEKYKLDEILFI